jgi:ribonuclease HI
VIGAGLISFWTAPWIGFPLLGPFPVHASLSVRDALADEGVLSLLSADQREEVSKVVLSPGIEDKMIWCHDKAGLFSTSGFWKHNRIKSPSVFWGLKIWQRWIPSKVSIFMWKLLQGALPVDSNLIRLQIPIVSKCSCCLSHPQVEDIDHLFLHSDIAHKVWSFFGSRLHVPMHHLSISSLFKFWTKISIKSQAGACYMAVLFFSCWEIWKDRCTAVFEGIDMQAERVIKKVCSSVKEVLLVYKPKVPSDSLCCFWMESLHWPIIQVQRKRGKWLVWSPGSSTPYNLFVDGSSRQGFCSGGGIIRNVRGDFIHAFSHFYGPGTNMRGEIGALHDGLALCKELGLDSVSIASDSMITVQILEGKLHPPWQYSYEVRACRHLLDTWPLRHVFREINGVADGLASWAHEHREKLKLDTVDILPRRIRVSLSQDQHGVPYFRQNV